MIDKARKILIILAVILGISHLIFGIFVYDTINLEIAWFLGSGIAMLVTALANIQTDKIGVLRLQNALMVIFLIGLATLAPLPQVLFGLILFTGLLGLSYLKRPAVE